MIKNNDIKKTLIMVTGSSGYIGKELLSCLQGYNCIGVDWKTIATKSQYTFINADLRQPNIVKNIFKKYSPHILYHFAALISPEVNEKEIELAIESHITITQNILDNLSDNTHLFFLSTDKVFDGSLLHPNEDAPTHPIWTYGKLKLQCENMIQKNIEKYHILRLPIVHSFGNPDSSSFIDKALIEIKNKKTVQIYDNVFRCYILVSDLITVLKKLIYDDHYGIYHVGTEMMSYCDRIKQLCNKQLLSYEKFLQSVQGVVRPLKQNLDTTKIRTLLNFDFH